MLHSEDVLKIHFVWIAEYMTHKQKSANAMTDLAEITVKKLHLNMTDIPDVLLI